MNCKELKYKPIEWFARGMALLPLGVLYLVADLLFILLYYIVRYRRKTVIDNLRPSFPDMSEKEIKATARRFFRNFADYIVETVKLLHISDKEMRKRMTFSGVDIIDDALAQGRPVVCYFSHTGNWEWAPSITLWSRMSEGDKAVFCQIYRPLRDSWFDSFMLRLRSRFGSVSLPKKRAFLDLLRYRKDGIPSVTGFMSDQKPSHGDTIHVVDFLNHPTAIITGTETVCRRLGALPVYWRMSKPSRGHYHIDVIEMSADLDKPFSLTDMYAEMLQDNIRLQPDIWLWSHKRWKNPVTFEMNGEKVV